MASAKSFALKALRSNLTVQRLSSTIPGQFQNGLVKSQPYQRALRPAFVPVRWHSIPASARSKDYNFSQIQEFATSPSEDRLLIGKPIHRNTSSHHNHHHTQAHTSSTRRPRTLRILSRLHPRRAQHPCKIAARRHVPARRRVRGPLRFQQTRDGQRAGFLLQSGRPELGGCVSGEAGGL
jgi:hypothetical protein